jgi:Ca-activated chloride channel family protein
MMDFVGRLDWANPWAFLLLLAIPLLWYIFIHKTADADEAFIFPSTHAWQKVHSFKITLYYYLPYLRLIGFLFLVLALARPQWMLREEKINAEGIDIFLALDLSSSMLSRDFDPNRLEISKVVAKDFISQRPYDRIGLVAFAGEGFTQCPLTADHQVLSHLLEQLECGFLEDGTAIGMGLMAALNRLKEDSAVSKIIILLTDGVNNAGEISPEIAMEVAKQFDIKIYSIGVGSIGEAYSPIGRNSQGEYVFGMAPVNIDESLLSKISMETGGKYYRATNVEKLKEIYQEIDQLEKTKMEVKVFKRYTEEYRPFLIIALIFLLMDWILRGTYLQVLRTYV